MIVFAILYDEMKNISTIKPILYLLKLTNLLYPFTVLWYISGLLRIIVSVQSSCHIMKTIFLLTEPPQSITFRSRSSSTFISLWPGIEFFTAFFPPLLLISAHNEVIPNHFYGPIDLYSPVPVVFDVCLTIPPFWRFFTIRGKTGAFIDVGHIIGENVKWDHSGYCVCRMIWDSSILFRLLFGKSCSSFDYCRYHVRCFATTISAISPA